MVGGSMLDFGFYNMDCMEGMKEFPDNYFDLAIVDPPYGAGGGSGKELTRADSVEGLTDTNKVERTGGTWAKKYGKKSYRGTLPRRKHILTSFFVSHAIRSYGAVTTFNYHLHGAF
jgi:DNA modification methylase